jgi:DNA-binding transcriptional LysR family regulator
LKDLLTTSAVIRSSASTFDPKLSTREFTIIVTEAGVVHLMLAIISHLEKEGSGLRLKAVPLDSRPIEARLETGEADVALGAFPTATPTLRCQLLYADTYASVVRVGHPRLGKLTNVKSFMSERHVIVTSPNRGSEAHRSLEQKLSSRLEPDRVHVRVPNFVTSAFVASRTDAVSTIPAKLAEYLAEDCHLAIFPPPLALPRIEISQFWYERVHNDQGHRWFRQAIYTLFGATNPKVYQRPGKDGARAMALPPGARVR